MAALHSCGVVVCPCYFFSCRGLPEGSGHDVILCCVCWDLKVSEFAQFVGRGGKCLVRIAADVVVVPKMHCRRFTLAPPSPNAFYSYPHFLRTTQGWPSHDPTQLVGPACSEVADIVGTAYGLSRISLPANSLAAGAPPVTEQRRYSTQSPEVRVTRSPSRTVMQRLVTSALDQHGDS